ncbi:MAG: GTPase Era [Candidatus Binatia bacterium]
MVDTHTDVTADAEPAHRSGFVAIIGRPNVGKSTLLNQLVGQKVAIVSPKPQTTRQRLLGVKTLPRAQVIFIDTPGLHAPRHLLGRRMVETAERAVGEADLLVWVVDVTAGLGTADRQIAQRLREEGRRACVVVNKIDRVVPLQLLPLLATLDQLLPGRHVIPVSALHGANLGELLDHIVRALPAGPRYYDPDALTDQSERMLAQEVVREKVLLHTHREVPYAVVVTVEKFEEKGSLTVIGAAIHVERQSQKGILIGQRGARIKEIGRAARLELEAMLGRRIYLELFVRVQEGWSRREALLKEFGL